MAPQSPRMPTQQRRSTLDEDHVFDNAAVGHQLNADRHDMLAPDFSRVLVIYTGGTIGMKHTPEHGYIPFPNYLAKSLSRVQRFHDPRNPYGYSTMSRRSSSDSVDSLQSDQSQQQDPLTSPSPPIMDSSFGQITNTVRSISRVKDESSSQQKDELIIQQLPSLITPISLYGKRIRYSILEYDPLLDSCNMTMEDWVRIAKDIEVNYEYFDAFIVLHGTDTMAYTASALSFMLEELGKTVIITGSQVPLTEVRNDAVENLLGALTIAGHFVIPEVSLYFGKRLYRGNRTSKISAVDFEAFDSPNLPSLVDVGIDIDVRWPLVLRPTEISKFFASTKLNPNVATLRLFPGINETTVRMMLAAPTEGVVLETYGAGNAPARPELLQALKEASDRGVVIVNCTQCRKGLVTDVYATGKQLAKVGVVAGADMTPECALTKLSYLLGRVPDDPAKVRQLMTKNLRGELTVRTLQTKFSASSNRTHALVEVIMDWIGQGKWAAKQQHHGDNDRKDDINKYLALPDLTLSNEDQQLVERSLGPVLLCSAAGTNDMDGLTSLYESMGDHMNVNCVDYDGRVPLHVASREGHIEIVEFLLKHGAAVHIRDRSGHTPLYEALVWKRSEVVRMLCRAGAHLAEVELDDFGYVWMKAVRDGDVKFIKLALESGWRVNWAESIEQRRAVDIAVMEGKLTVLKVLLGESDLDLTSPDRWGTTIQMKLNILRQNLTTMVDTPSRLGLTIDVVDEMERLIKNRLR
ncbi:asparaginase-domain-containing protein [Halteromyces radiatus]|uniref:asparaginase-domain-containing protein n=1 Tax=Halteromyces radiatus TaxID=101107 RepID=UPI00221F4754|nr:asparaginase-domain-containing protein [Halteromyces radiatus]KAI8086569.1 asparaginase-domain-containing protein [Halteromyces radiatus]